ncbi:TPA: hypothetical protein ACH3X3_002257 [Trebouxia sp. C0006]
MGAAAAAQTCPYLPTEESWKSGKVRPSAFQVLTCKGPTGARQDSWHDADALTKLKRDLVNGMRPCATQLLHDLVKT